MSVDIIPTRRRHFAYLRGLNDLDCDAQDLLDDWNVASARLRDLQSVQEMRESRRERLLLALYDAGVRHRRGSRARSTPDFCCCRSSRTGGARLRKHSQENVWRCGENPPRTGTLPIAIPRNRARGRGRTETGHSTGQRLDVTDAQ